MSSSPLPESLGRPSVGDALAEQSYQLLRDAILTGQLPPGTRLSASEVARRLGVSRSPAKEAIARIAHEELARVESRGGAVVAEISNAELREIYDLREVLEGLACRLAVAGVTDEDTRDLSTLLADHRAAIASGQVGHHMDIDQAFHLKIRQIAGSRRLLESLSRLQGQVRIAMGKTHRSAGGMKQAADEHEQILLALQDKDADRAETLGRQHVRRLRNELEDFSRPTTEEGSAMPGPDSSHHGTE